MSEHGPSVKTYLWVLFILLMFTMATYNVAFWDLGALTVPIALAIAITKATLVVLVFMHVKYSERLVAVFVVAGFATLALMLVGTLHDYWSRGWLG